MAIEDNEDIVDSVYNMGIVSFVKTCIEYTYLEGTKQGKLYYIRPYMKDESLHVAAKIKDGTLDINIIIEQDDK